MAQGWGLHLLYGVSRCPSAPGPATRAGVYSITFDEALKHLHRCTVPIMERLGVPGHVEVVVGAVLGQVRQVGQSSYHGMRHMGPAERRDLLARGWGVGNHSWSHGAVTAETAEAGGGQARVVLEEANPGPGDGRPPAPRGATPT